MASRTSEAAYARLDDQIRAHRSPDTTAVGSSVDPIEIDSELRRLSTRDAALRVAFGTLASELCRKRVHHRLGFARLGDYTRERLGMAPREVESLAHVATALRALPLVAAAFARGELSWTHTRLLVAVATPATEAQWLERARGCSTARLAALMGASSAARSTDCPSGDLVTHRRFVEATLDETFDRADGEPILRFRLRCPPQLRGLFYDTVELARRVAGVQLPLSDAAEAIAAEALSGAPRVAAIGPDVPRSTDAHEAPRNTPVAAPASPPFTPSMQTPCNATSLQDIAAPNLAPDLKLSTAAPHAAAQDVAAPHVAAQHVAAQHVVVSSPAPSLQSAACDLDARLRSAVAAMRAIDWQIGHLLETIHRRRLYRALGFRSLAHYVRDRVGIAPRTARALMATERVTSECPPLRDAYHTGEVSWLQALTIGPVVVHAPEDIGTAWVARARRVTLRRLTDEVEWALAAATLASPVLSFRHLSTVACKTKTGKSVRQFPSHASPSRNR